MAIWHDDPALKGRFHPDYPDDIQVIVHEGSFRFTDTRPEVMWSRIQARLEVDRGRGSILQVYKAVLLNKPHQLKTLEVEQEILFLAHEGYQYPVRVTQDYIDDRFHYDIVPCQGCGLPEVFDPISKLIEHSFSNLKDQPGNVHHMAFTSFCPLCGNVMVVRHRDFADIVTKPSSAEPANIWTQVKKWLRLS